MPEPSHYFVLGVPPSESTEGIRAAYRDLARQLHPDTAGETGTRALQRVGEAYRILSDPALRRAYDDELRRSRAGAARPPIALLDDPDSIHPSYEALFERLVRNFTGVHVPKSEHLERLSFDLILTPDEAAAGVVVPIAVPTFEVCPRCRGSGRDWGYPCPSCGQTGTLRVDRRVELAIPPGAETGMWVELALHQLGIRNLYLCGQIHVAPP